jgi:hypothetical protein
MNTENTALDQQQRWDFLFRQLKELLSKPSESHPAARIWEQTDLVKVISGLRKEHVQLLKSNFPSAKEVVARMKAIGWLLPVPIAARSKANADLYLLDMESTPEDRPDVLELLQGFEPDGVLCYASVLAFHELTTQQPPIAHVGILKNYEPSTATERLPTPASDETMDQRRSDRDLLGSYLFSYEGTKCYRTRRDRALTPGVQTRILGPRTRLRVTTLEQTLLDTLFHPVRCGGEAIVFEAWERGLERWNPSRLADHLKAIGREDFLRRVGAMLSLQGIDSFPDSLHSLLAAASARWRNRTAHEEPIALLRQMSYSRLLTEWGVFIP